MAFLTDHNTLNGDQRAYRPIYSVGFDSHIADKDVMRPQAVFPPIGMSARPAMKAINVSTTRPSNTLYMQGLKYALLPATSH